MQSTMKRTTVSQVIVIFDHFDASLCRSAPPPIK
jgi:hypothetical protein